MGIDNKKILDATDVAGTQNSSAFGCEEYDKICVVAAFSGNNTANQTFDTGTFAIHTLTVPALAGAVDGDYLTAYDSAGILYAVGLDTTGGASVTPTGAAWVAADYKVLKDVSGATTAADVMALVETAINTLTGFTTAVTSNDTAADGTMTLTQVIPGVTSLGNDYSDDGAAGTGTGITVVSSTTGVATEVDIANNKVTVPIEYVTGTKITELTTDGTLPAGLSLSTIYYIIANGDGTISFATSQALALAGTAVDITGYGATTSVNTIVVDTDLAGSVKLQKNIEPASETANWVDYGDGEVLNANNSQSFSAAGNLQWAIPDLCCNQIRAVVTVTSGTLTFNVRGYSKY